MSLIAKLEGRTACLWGMGPQDFVHLVVDILGDAGFSVDFRASRTERDGPVSLLVVGDDDAIRQVTGDVRRLVGVGDVDEVGRSRAGERAVALTFA